MQSTYEQFYIWIENSMRLGIFDKTMVKSAHNYQLYLDIEINQDYAKKLDETKDVLKYFQYEIEDEEYYKVDKIIDRKVSFDGVLMYRIRWVGYSESSDTWEPLNHLTNLKKEVQQFDKRYFQTMKTTAKQVNKIQDHINQKLQTKPKNERKGSQKQSALDSTLNQNENQSCLKNMDQSMAEQKMTQKQLRKDQLLKITQEANAFYQVQQIISKKTFTLRGRNQKKVLYRVRWTGYTQKDDTWEPIENLGMAFQMVNDFNEKNSNIQQHQLELRAKINTQDSKLVIKTQKEDVKKRKRIRKRRRTYLDNREGKQKESTKCYYEVQKIIDKKIINGNQEYRVRWKGYSQREDTWEPKSHLHKIPKLIQKYENEKLPNRPGIQNKNIHDNNNAIQNTSERVIQNRQDASILKQTDNYEIGGNYYEDQSMIREEIDYLEGESQSNQLRVEDIDIDEIPNLMQERQLIEAHFI